MSHIQQRSDDQKGGPPCATRPYHRGLMGGYPSSIRSSLFLHQGERSNNAQHAPSNSHRNEDQRRIFLPFSHINHGLEPRASSFRTEPQTVTACTAWTYRLGPGCTQGGIPGYIPGGSTTYPTHPGVYTGGLPTYPPGCIYGVIHLPTGVYTQHALPYPRVYIPSMLSHTRVYTGHHPSYSGVYNGHHPSYPRV